MKTIPQILQNLYLHGLQSRDLANSHHFLTLLTSANPIQFFSETQKKENAKAFEKTYPFRFNYIHSLYPSKCENAGANKSNNKMLSEQNRFVQKMFE